MLNPARLDEKETDRKRALLDVERALRKIGSISFERLGDNKLRSIYKTRHFTDGWRISVSFSDGVTRRLDLIVSRLFPVTAVRAALVDRPEYLTWPHIEHDGILCLLANASEIDPDRPEEVALNILHRSIKLIEELIEGTIVDRDFKEEFLTYWFYGATDSAKDVVTLFAPNPPSRVLRVINHGGLTYVAENDVSLVRWIRNRFGRKVANKVSAHSIPAALVWLDQPLLPSQYPQTGQDVLTIAKGQDSEAVDAVTEAALHDGDVSLTLFGAEGRGGPGLVPVQIDRENSRRGMNRRAKDQLHKGFRRGKTPCEVKLAKTYGGNKVRRSQVDRADAQWVHGRGKDPRSVTLAQKTTTVFGCGSVGSFVIENLARSGVRTINLVDYDKMVWANVGRHSLGASSVGENKAVALAEKLQQEFPHLDIVGHDTSVLAILEHDEMQLLNSDLILSMMGNWAAESALNKWHEQTGRERPIIYGWTENHAMAGSAVVIAKNGGCLNCGLNRTGTPHKTAIIWPEGRELNTEPSCSDHYQPYGAIELAFITSLISNVAIDGLLEASNESYRAIWVSSLQRLANLGGKFSNTVLDELGEKTAGSSIFHIPWVAGDCAICN